MVTVSQLADRSGEPQTQCAERYGMQRGKAFVIASLIPLASSFHVSIIMRQDELPLGTKYLLSTTAKTAAPRGKGCSFGTE